MERTATLNANPPRRMKRFTNKKECADALRDASDALFWLAGQSPRMHNNRTLDLAQTLKSWAKNVIENT